jgi:hypothetical protein
MRATPKAALELAKKLQGEAPATFVPPSEGIKAQSQSVLPNDLVHKTRGYIERIATQINGTYENGWFDACAVMMRRLIETLIIECFEAHRISDKIKNKSTGELFYLGDLVAATLTEVSWNLGRNAKRALPRLKDLGDQSAHSRRFIAHREDIDKILPDFRYVCQELIFLAGLK